MICLQKSKERLGSPYLIRPPSSIVLQNEKIDLLIFFRLFLEALETVASERSNSFDFSKSNTYFVPTDEAFRRIGETRLKRMMSDTVYLNKVSLKCN